MDVIGISRVCWIEAQIKNPAGETVTLNAMFDKEPSFDSHCIATKNEGVSGYDLVTALGRISVIHNRLPVWKLEDRLKFFARHKAIYHEQLSKGVTIERLALAG